MRSYDSQPEGAEPAPNPLAGVRFTLDGQVFECLGEPDMLDQSELALLAANGTDIRTPEAQAAIAAFLQMAFGPQEYSRFRMHTKSHRTAPEVILAIMAGINEELEGFIVAATERPTGQPSPSSTGGSERAEELRKVISLGKGEVTIVPPGTATGGQPGTPRKARSGKAGGSGKGGSSVHGAASSQGGLSLRARCDLAEHLLLAQREREDTLRLLATVGQGLGAKHLAEYETPREEWEEVMDRMAWTPGDLAAERAAAVEAFLAVAEQ